MGSIASTTPSQSGPGKTPQSKLAKRGVPKARPLRRESEPLDNVMRIRTPENISFHYEVAGPFRRLWAYLLDVLIAVVGYWFLIFLCWMLFAFAIGPLIEYMGLSGIFDEIGGVLIGFVMIGQFLTFWFYGAYFETYFNGATLGKSILNLRVITVHGHAVDGTSAVLRNFFRLIDLFPMVPMSAILEIPEAGGFALPTGIFGLIVMTMNRRYQRLGDLVANTVVVNEERSRRPQLEDFTDPRVPKLAELIPASFFVSPSLARSLADYVDNRRTLNYQRSSEIANFVAVPLIERFGMPADTDGDLLLCALYFKVFVQQELGDSQEVTEGDLASIELGSNATAPSTVNDNPFL